MDQEIMVSVLCLTYNHEKYIRSCLNGFVMQKTNFRFEVLIHDDASTDATASIIREYEEKYPEIIKPIYQTKNQYSQGIKINRTYQYPRVKGKYIALCEGDDDWIDEHKLQLQFDALEAHPECDSCFSIVDAIDARTDAHKWYHPNFSVKGLLSQKEFMDLLTSGGYHFQTSSYFLKTDTLLKYAAANPQYANAVPGAGDTATLLWFASNSGACFIDRVMSRYRLATENSWTVLQNTRPLDKVKHSMYQMKLWQQFDAYTSGIYHDKIQTVITREKAYTYLNYKPRRMAGKSKELDVFIKSIGFKERLKIRFSKYYFYNLKAKVFLSAERSTPALLRIYRKLKKVMKK